MIRKPRGFLAFVQTFSARLDLVHPSGAKIVAVLRSTQAEIWTTSPSVDIVPLGPGKTERYSAQGWVQWLTGEGQELAAIRNAPLPTALLALPAFAGLLEQWNDYVSDGVAIRNAIQAVLDLHTVATVLTQEQITNGQRSNLANFIEARLEV